jgi:glycosyltransferase involved in cell wall biosynthesis
MRIISFPVQKNGQVQHKRQRGSTPRGRILVVGPGGGVRGGIDAVISAHKATETWHSYGCELLCTYRDTSPLAKIRAALTAYVVFLRKVRRARVVHVHLAGETSLLRKLPIVALARFCTKPIVVHVHAAGPESLFERTPGWAVRFVLRSADRVVALSRTWSEIIRRQVPDAKVTIIPNPATMPRATDCVDGREPVVLFLGKLEGRKGYLDLIQAAKRVIQIVPSARFVFAGHGQTAQAEQTAAQLGISQAVRCLGWVDRKDLTHLLQRAAVFCLPSYDEGVPMAMLDAMSHGLPVVTTPVGGIPDLVFHNQNGILVTPGMIGQLTDELIRLLENKDGLRSRLGNAGRVTVEQFCGLDKVAAALAQLYDELAPEPFGSREIATASSSRAVRGTALKS